MSDHTPDIAEVFERNLQQVMINGRIERMRDMTTTEDGMPAFHAIKVGMVWKDSKGFKWEVFENLYFGKWRVRRADGSRVGEMFGNEIRAELRDEWKRKLRVQS